ncbi:hypothetical protein DH2020_003932 [Rehmannia glutinosa]|uniref:Protein TAR1 n=1 Tax=Rehmannia glutinosa TaxID=99300 RepID=A0ABR0XN16_REHGL
MLTRTLLGRSRSVGVAPLGDRARSASFAYGFTSPLTRTHVGLLGPCFKAGRMGARLRPARSTRFAKHAKARAYRHDRAAAFHGHIKLPGFGRRLNPLVRPESSADRLSPFHIRGTHRRPHPLPPDNFKHSLTLFSKSFSSFPRGTCSLSVSRPYLALGRNLPPDWGCIPKQPDSPQAAAPRGAAGVGHGRALTLSASLSGGLGPSAVRRFSRTTIRTAKHEVLKLGYSVRSPLLGESL